MRWLLNLYIEGERGWQEILTEGVGTQRFSQEIGNHEWGGGGVGETCCLGLLYCFKNLKSNGQSDKARSSWG